MRVISVNGLLADAAIVFAQLVTFHLKRGTLGGLHPVLRQSTQKRSDCPQGSLQKGSGTNFVESTVRG